MADFIDDDIVMMRRDDGSSQDYYWGDPVTRLPAEDQPGKLRVEMRGAGGLPVAGFISDKTKLRATALLRLSMIDVQQGDGLILETPSGKVVFIDGGDNQLFARHAAARFPGTSEANPQIIDAMIITHGDADHFSGLFELRASETNDVPRKRIFVAPKRVYHNGLVKRPGKDANGIERRDTAFFGATATVDEQLFATGLVEDPRDVAAPERNRPFNEWAATLDAWEPRTLAKTGSPIEIRRLDHESTGAFDFLDGDGVAVELLGPIVETVDGAPALRFLRDPPSDASLMLGNKPASSRGSYSASHTINGHSINFRLRFGNVRFMFTGDMNQESMERLRAVKPDTSLRAEILKAPHHGSADFDMDYLKDVSPVVSMISSGDESAVKEYIHPRATLMAALGKASRTTPAVILCTELVAFFATRGVVTVPGNPPRTFFAFERTNFGIIHIRTDGERVLAFTHSGRAGLNEAYRFTVSTTGSVEFAAKVVKRSAPKANA
jgi:beta-lactamase superfamily II metal-dependent hydrolase